MIFNFIFRVDGMLVWSLRVFFFVRRVFGFFKVCFDVVFVRFLRVDFFCFTVMWNFRRLALERFFIIKLEVEID